MRWEELTGDVFMDAVQQSEGVCLLPLSCIERHGSHLPLATDMFIGREVCNRAAALEPAIVFPDYIFTQILEVRHYPGCIGIEPELTIRLLESTCREIARNGVLKMNRRSAPNGKPAWMDMRVKKRPAPFWQSTLIWCAVLPCQQTARACRW